MSKPAKLVSATIVLIFIHAAFPAGASPQDTLPDDTGPGATADSTAPSGIKIDENMVVTEPEPVTPTFKARTAEYYPYRQQLTFRAGVISSNNKREWKDMVLGFQYLFPKFLSPKLEAGADLLPEGEGHLHAGVRWIHFERDYLRPSYKISLDHKVDASEKLATFAEIDNYYLRFSATVEYVFWNPYSIRLEPEILAGFKESYWMITLGLSRGW